MFENVFIFAYLGVIVEDDMKFDIEIYFFFPLRDNPLFYHFNCFFWRNFLLVSFSFLYR